MDDVLDVIIVGAGFAGLGMAVELKKAGMAGFVVLEKADQVGGTWRENTYPDAACDVPALLYSFSFAPNRSSRRMYPGQPEILDYLTRVVADFQLESHIRYGAQVVMKTFCADTDTWRVMTADGNEFRARFLVSACGPLHTPDIPKIPGQERFDGTRFHSADWDHDFDPAGKRIAVIGTGASAVQFIPRLAERAGELVVFQRTPHWILPKANHQFSRAAQRVLNKVPGLWRLCRTAVFLSYETVLTTLSRPALRPLLRAVAKRWLRHQVPEPGLREALTPDYAVGCKRLLVANDYYPALRRPNVSLVTDGIAELTEHGIRTDTGTDYEVDAIIYGTGFAKEDRYTSVGLFGRNGLTLGDVWRNGAEAHLGTTIAGFPNYFLLTGPNAGAANGSLVFHLECQVRYVRRCMGLMRARAATRIEVTPDAVAAFTRDMRRRSAGSVWTAGGCRSWFLDSRGENKAMWPGTMLSFWRATRRPRPDDFELTAHAVDHPSFVRGG